MIVEGNNQSYMLHPAFMDEAIFALQLDGTQQCVFLIDENNKHSFVCKTYSDLLNYFEEKRKRIEVAEQKILREKRLREEQEKEEQRKKKEEEERQRKQQEEYETIETLRRNICPHYKKSIFLLLESPDVIQLLLTSFFITIFIIVLPMLHNLNLPTIVVTIGDLLFVIFIVLALVFLPEISQILSRRFGTSMLYKFYVQDRKMIEDWVKQHPNDKRSDKIMWKSFEDYLLRLRTISGIISHSE